MGRHGKCFSLVFLIVSCGIIYSAPLTSDTLQARKHIKADTATASIKSVTLTAAPIATSYSADSALVIQNGVIKKRYTPPTIATLTNTTGALYTGQTVTALTVNWTLIGAPITSQTLTDCTPALSDRAHAFTGLSLTTDKYYTLAITDGTTPTSANTWVYFLIAKYLDTTSAETPAAADVNRGIKNWQYQNAAYRAQTSISVNGYSKYVYYAYPKSWGDVQLFANGFAVTWVKSTVSITNAYGDTRDYYVYITATTNVGSFIFSATGL